MTLFTILVFLCTYADFAIAMVRRFWLTERRNGFTRWIALAGVVSFAWQAWGLWGGGGLFWRSVLGCLQYFVAWGLFRWALASLGTRRLSAIGQPDLPEYVHRRGPYGWFRHPLYLAYSIAWLGSWTVTADPLQLIPVAVMGASYFYASRQEEQKFRRSSQAEAYEAYRREVGLFFPLRTDGHTWSRGRDWFGGSGPDIL